MTDTPQMTADEFLRGLDTLGWSQVQFADRAGVTKGTVNRWVHGRLAVPAWAANHLRLLLDARKFCANHVAPPPRFRSISLDEPLLAMKVLMYLRRARKLRLDGGTGAEELEQLARAELEFLLRVNSIAPDNHMTADGEPVTE